MRLLVPFAAGGPTDVCAHLNAYGNTPAENLPAQEIARWKDVARAATSRPNNKMAETLMRETLAETGAIDCDVHPSVPGHHGAAAASGNLLAGFGRTSAGSTSLDSNSYPPKSPLTSRPEWRGKNGLPATDAQAGRRSGVRPLAGGLRDPQLPLRRATSVQRGHGGGVRRALNDWIAKEWLDRDPRLRASIVMPMQNVEYAVDEIERCAKDKRFVQVLVLAMQEVPLGRRHFWPIYRRRRAARPADRHPCRLEPTAIR